MSESQATIASNKAYKLECLLRILSLASDGQQVAGRSFDQCGGGMVLDMAADMAGEIVEALDHGKEKVS